MTYAQVLSTIRAALSQRPAGTKVQVSAHEAAEIALLNYIEDKPTGTGGGETVISRNAHAISVAEMNCDLVWNNPFLNTSYSFVYHGFDNSGNPVEITFLSKSNTKIIVSTMIAANIFAIANPY